MALQQVLIHQEPKPALAPNVRKAIQIAAPNFGQDKALVTLQAFVLDASPDLGYPLPYFNNQNELKHWVRQLTAALTWSVIGQYEPAISWDNVIVWSPQFIPTDTALSQEEAINRILEKKRLKENLDDIDWLQGWSPHPPWPQDIYRLGVTFLPVEDTDEEIAVIFHHTFYNSLNWYVWVDMPYKIAEQLFVVCKPIDKESA
ncbi:MAG TPA: hypothetical protein VLL52_05975 [Anaerolineae bacterium]|nr:hypothetical protein [Anaerolineae bacterium]